MEIKYLILLLLFTGLTSVNAQQLAFPGAEGYGKYTIGGRGGTVYEVTNLNDAGAGSLRAAVEASGPRTVIFRVSGTINLTKELKISNPYITIAGQTAPGDGICLKKYSLNIAANQVIIRYIRVRFGSESGVDADAVSSRYTKNVILDHVSASWSVDETMSVYHCDSVTVQWCLVSESLYNSNHEKGAHGFGGIAGSNNSSYHHNLFAHHSSRNPRIASGCGYFDYRNNVIYNWGYNSCYGGEQQQQGDSKRVFTTVNMVANYYKPGPATRPGNTTYRIVNPSYRDVKTDYGKWYVANNIMVGNATVSSNNWNGGVQPQDGTGDIPLLKLDSPWPSMAFYQQPAEEAYQSVLDNVGATLPKRDIVDTRIINNTRNGDATYEGATYKQNQSVPDRTKICGIIDTEANVGGWPELKSITAPADTDHDGIPDNWENVHGLNINNKEDGKMVGKDGYTNLEKYLNSIEFLNPVSGYKLTKLSETSYKLEWSDNYLAEDGFRVERSFNNGKFETIVTLPKYSNSYTDNSVSSGLVTYRVVAYNSDNVTPESAGISNTVTTVNNLVSTSGNIKLNCFPNPFSEILYFEISVSEPQKTRIELFDISGKKIATIADRILQANKNSLVWNSSNSGCNLKDGTYIVSVTTKNSSIKKEVKIIRKSGLK